MSYLIKNNQVIAETRETLKSGTEVKASFQCSKESINADREVNLVNAFWVKVSNAKKWANDKYFTNTFAEEVNDGEYLLS